MTQQLELTPQQTRAEQIRQAFEHFHAAHPEVWALFQQFAFEMLGTGRKHYSARLICNRIAWHTDITSRASEPEDFKINNNFSPYYARLFHRTFPEHGGFFFNRELTSKHQDAL